MSSERTWLCSTVRMFGVFCRLHFTTVPCRKKRRFIILFLFVRSSSELLLERAFHSALGDCVLLLSFFQQSVVTQVSSVDTHFLILNTFCPFIGIFVYFLFLFYLVSSGGGTLTAISLFYSPHRKPRLPVCTRRFFLPLSLKAVWWIFNRLSVCFYGSLAMNFLPSAGANHLWRAVQNASFPPTSICLLICVSLWAREKGEKSLKWANLLNYLSCTVKKENNNKKYFWLFFFSSFKHMIGCLEDVSCKGNEDADAKAK